MDCDQQFSLSWNNFHGNVSRELSVLFGTGTLADVTLAVGGELLQAHRLVLAICSPYFKKMFQTNPHHHPIVVLRDVTLKAMQDLLQFMYYGEVSVKREDLTSFIATAELLQIKGLTNKEGEELEREIETSRKNTQEINVLHNRPQQRLSENEPTMENNISKQAVELKRKFLNEKIQKLQLKQNLQNFYQTELPEKRRCTEEQNNHSVEKSQYYEEKPENLCYSESHTNQNNDVDSYDEALNLKTEFDDDIIVTDPALANVNKSFEHCSPDLINKDTPVQNEGLLSRMTNDCRLPVRYRYIYSRKGHKQLVHMNFVYTKHSTTHGKTSWRCVQYFSLNRCPATVETVENKLFAINHQHNHDDFFDKIAKNVIYESKEDQ